MPETADAIRKLDTSVRKRVLLRIKWLSVNLDIIKHQMLTGKLHGIYKHRMGDYRILYSIDKTNRILFIHRFGHRRDIYE